MVNTTCSLKGSEPANASQIEMFSTIKADALRKLDVDLGSVEGPQRFHPSNAIPVNWYETAANENWTHFHIASEDQPTSLPGIVLDPRLHQFRVVPVALRPMFDRPTIQLTFHQLAFSLEPSHPEPRLTTTQAFATDVLQASHQLPVLVEFWASWCGACRFLSPKIQNAIRSAQNEIQWIRIDVDKDPVQKFVTAASIPTLIAFTNGQAADRLVGNLDESHILYSVD